VKRSMSTPNLSASKRRRRKGELVAAQQPGEDNDQVTRPS